MVKPCVAISLLLDGYGGGDNRPFRKVANLSNFLECANNISPSPFALDHQWIYFGGVIMIGGDFGLK